jgi:threonine dehydratase
LTSSSGNFAQAVAYAAKKLGVSAKIVMREDTAPIKLAGTASWGAEIALCEASQAARFAMVSALQRVEQRHLLHPFDSLETIAADGTIGLEIAEDLGEAAMILVPVSGGGLVSGIATALHHRFVGSQVYGVQSEKNGSFLRALKAGKPVEVEAFSSCADALVATSTGEQAFSFARPYVAGGIEVSEEAIVEAVCWLATEMPLVVEAGGAVGVAAILSGCIPSSSLPLVCVLSGGNLDRSKLVAWIEEKSSKNR